MGMSRVQGQFTYMVGQLIQFAYANGFYLTFGDAFATEGHSVGSYHYKRLAVDFNLFNAKTGAYMINTRDFEPLGLFWESIGGTWGGRFTNIEGGDGNHFSFGE